MLISKRTGRYNVELELRRYDDSAGTYFLVKKYARGERNGMRRQYAAIRAEIDSVPFDTETDARRYFERC